jgi:hypothetical protein
MAIISSYPTVTPTGSDLIIGTDVSTTPNSTKTFTVSSISALSPQGTVTSVALTMPAAFSVAGSPVTSAGTLAVTGAGTSSQVILGDGTLGSLPGGPFLPLAGGTMVGNTLHGDNVKSIYGTGSDLEIFFDGVNSNIQETAAAIGTLQVIAKQAVAIKTTSTTNLLTGGGGNDTELSDTNGVTRLALTTSNVIFPSGSLGIGTTSPDYKLEVSGTLGVSRTDGIIFAGSLGTGTGSKIVSNTSNDLIFSTALASSPYTTTERVRILNNGIGTTGPASKLEVDGGDIEIDDSASGLILRSPNGTRYRVKVDNSGNLTTTTV